jgi:protein TonB
MQVPESTPMRPKVEPRHTKPAVPHSGAGSAVELAGAASHGANRGPLSSHASYLSNPKPDYPPDARRQRQEGVVVVNVEVEADGRAGDVNVSRSSGFPLLDDAAVRAVRRWLFEPARAGGLPVASRVDVPVRFSLAR